MKKISISYSNRDFEVEFEALDVISVYEFVHSSLSGRRIAYRTYRNSYFCAEFKDVLGYEKTAMAVVKKYLSEDKK